MIELGRFRVHLLSDGSIAMDGGAMFGVVPKPLWERDFPADESNRISMSLHCPLITDGHEVILIDTGVGDRLSEKERRLYRVDRREGLLRRIHEAGIDPEQVTQIVLTHLHFDHVGGVVARDASGHLRPAFPRARHFVQRAELETALRPTNERLQTAYGHARECLDPLHESGLLEVLDGNERISSHLKVVVTGGHTPSHQCPILADTGDTFCHLGDIAPTRAHLRPAWNQAFDVDPLVTLSAKKDLLERAQREHWVVSFDHDHRVACGRVGDNWSKGTLEEEIPHDAA